VAAGDVFVVGIVASSWSAMSVTDLVMYLCGHHRPFDLRREVWSRPGSDGYVVQITIAELRVMRKC